MKKIINNLLYNTETAKAVGDHWNGIPRNDFSYCDETLYQKRTGEFFLHGEGGPSSKYAETVGMNEWSGGEKIIPLSYDEARAWAEEKLDADEYEKIFGEVSEGDEEKARLHLSVSASAFAKLKKLAAQNRVSMTEYVENMINNI